MGKRLFRRWGTGSAFAAAAIALSIVLPLGASGDALAQTVADETAQAIDELQTGDVKLAPIPMDQIPIGGDSADVDGETTVDNVPDASKEIGESPSAPAAIDSESEALGNESTAQNESTLADDEVDLQDLATPVPTAAGDPPGQPTWTFPDMPRTDAPNYGPISMVGTDGTGDSSWNREIVVITGLRQFNGRIVPATTRVRAGDFTQEWIEKNNVPIWAYPGAEPEKHKVKLLSPSPAGFGDDLCMSIANSTDDQGGDAVYLTSCDEAKIWQLIGDPTRCRPGGPAGEQCYRWFLAAQVDTKLCGLHLESTGYQMIPPNDTLNYGRSASVICQDEGQGYYGPWGELTPLGIGHDKPEPTPTSTVKKLVRVDGGGYASTGTANPGSTLTYMLRFTNPGSIPAQIKYVDDLRDVMQNTQDFTVVDNGGLTTYPPSSPLIGNMLTIVGDLDAGQSKTFIYTVDIKDTAQASDTLTNKVYPDSAPSLSPTPATCDTSAGDCTVTTITTKPTLTVIQRVIPVDQQVPNEADFDALMAMSQLAAGWEFTVSPGWMLDGTPATQQTAGPGPSFGTASFAFGSTGAATITQVQQDGFHNVPVFGPDESAAGIHKYFPAQCVDANTGAGTSVTIWNGNMRPTMGDDSLVECTYFAQPDPSPDLETGKWITAVERDGQALSGVTNSTPLASGDTVTYSISVSNQGTDAGTTTLTEAVPQGATYVGGAAEGWTYDSVNDRYTQDVTVDPGGSKSVTFTVVLNDPVDDGQTEVTNTVATSEGACDPCTVTNPIGWGFQVYKVAEDEGGNLVGMPGTEWRLWSAQTGGTELATVEQYLNDHGDPVSGLFKVSHLLAGTYWLEEAKAPDGFALLAQRVEVTVSTDGTVEVGPGGKSSNITTLDGHDPSNPGKPGVPIIRVNDVPKVELPKAGGVGTWATGTAIGVGVLIAVGGLVLRRYIGTRGMSAAASPSPRHRA